MANRRFIQFYQTLHKSPVQLDCNFIVDATDSGGLGIKSLKGPGIANVYMHTSATPASGNPNPASGYIYVQLQDNYNFYYFGGSQIQDPLTGSALNISGSSLTAGVPYVVNSIGTSVAADFQTVGLPSGTTPAVGASFIATATGGASGTGTVKAVGSSGVAAISVVGDPNKTILSSGAAVQGSWSGAYLILKCYDYAGAVVAPALNSVIDLNFVFSNSSILIGGD